MKRKKAFFLGFLGFLMIFMVRIWGTEPRTAPIDLYLIIDSSSAMERAKQEAVDWLCANVIDTILQQGDGLYIWTAGEKPELIYADPQLNDKEAPKNAIRSLKFEGEKADYRGALEEVQAKVRQNNGRMVYTLLASGSGAKDPPSQEAESAGLLRHSRVDHFSGWRLLTIGFDLNQRVRQSTSTFMNQQ